MPAWGWLLVIGLVTAVGLAVYWLFILTEGAYLGPRMVTVLYSRFASRYDRIKQFSPEDEAYFLGQPMARILAEIGSLPGRQPWVLDVAAGSGRYPLALLPEVDGRCQVVALDSSRNMLQQAQRNLANWPQVIYVQHEAVPLPFAAGQFDVVACLEALEFMPSPRAVLQELLRVLRPGGVLVLSNRIGWQARLMPGKTYSRQALTQALNDLGATAMQISPWQMDYDLAMALKAGSAPVAGAAVGSNGQHGSWVERLQCPKCQGRSWRSEAVATSPTGPDAPGVLCDRCGWQLTCRDGIWAH